MTRKSANLSSSAHQALTVISDITNLPISKLIEQFATTLLTNKATIELTLARSGRFDLRDCITSGIEGLSRASDRAYYRRQQEEAKLKQVKLAAETKPTSNDIIKSNVREGMDWSDLHSTILEAYPDFQVRLAHEVYIASPRFYHESNVVQRATRSQFKVNSVGKVVRQ